MRSLREALRKQGFTVYSYGSGAHWEHGEEGLPYNHVTLVIPRNKKPSKELRRCQDFLYTWEDAFDTEYEAFLVESEDGDPAVIRVQDRNAAEICDSVGYVGYPEEDDDDASDSF